MSKCHTCGVNILDETERCPLCHSVLEQTEELENMYPNVRRTTRRLDLISRIYLFCAILLEAVLVGINICLEHELLWCVISGLVLLYVYFVLRYAVLGKWSYKNKITVLALIAVLAAIAIDFVTGYRGWSVDYVLPVGILYVDANIIGLMIYNRRNWQSYMMWQILMILCSLIPAALFLLKLDHNPYMAFLPLAASGFLFLGTLIIGDRRARVELKRRFHI